MVKTLPSGEYTQLNTNDTEYLIQNHSSYNLFIKIASSQPADDDEYDFIIEPLKCLSNSNIAGICWGKPSGKSSIPAGIVEG